MLYESGSQSRWDFPSLVIRSAGHKHSRGASTSLHRTSQLSATNGIQCINNLRYFWSFAFTERHLWKGLEMTRSRVFSTSGGRYRVCVSHLDSIIIQLTFWDSVQDPSSESERRPSSSGMGRSWSATLEGKDTYHRKIQRRSDAIRGCNNW